MKQSILVFISILALGFMTSCQQDEILTEEATITAEVYEASKTGDEVEESDLPEAVTTYISENYPESTIERAKSSDKGYGVKLDTGEFLVFDLEGNFVGERTGGKGGHGHGGKGHGSSIDVSELPTVITDYITANYPDTTIDRAVATDDGFKVKLDDETYLIFDADGNFVEVGEGHGGKGGKHIRGGRG